MSLLPPSNHNWSNEYRPHENAYEKPRLTFDNKVNRLVVPLYCGTCRQYGCQCFSSKPRHDNSDTNSSEATTTTFSDSTSLSNTSSDYFYNMNNFSPVQTPHDYHHFNNNRFSFYNNNVNMNQMNRQANVYYPRNYGYHPNNYIQARVPESSHQPVSSRLRKNPYMIEKMVQNRHSSVIDSCYFGHSKKMNTGNKLEVTSQFDSGDKGWLSSNSSNVDSGYRGHVKLKTTRPMVATGTKHQYPGYEKTPHPKNTNSYNKPQKNLVANPSVRNKKFAAYESILYNQNSSSQQTSTSSSLSCSPTPLLDHFSAYQYNQYKPVRGTQVLCRLGHSCRFKRENKCKYYHPVSPSAKSSGKHKNNIDNTPIDISDYSLILNETGLNLELNTDDLPDKYLV